VASVACLTWPTAKDYDYSHRAKSQKTALMSGDCVKYQLPSFLFIGMGHSGSTSLAALMNLHDDLSYGDMKEHNFFACGDSDSDCMLDYDVDAYKAEFGVDCGTKYTFDASQNYLAIAEKDSTEDQEAVEMVYSILPNVSIMVAIRDPVEYFFSLNVTELEDMFNWPFMKITKERIQIWESVYDPSRFIFIDSQDAFKNMSAEANRIFDWMGLESRTFTDDELTDLENSGRRRSTQKPSQELREAYYADEFVQKQKKELEELVGITFDWEGSS